MTFSFFNFFLGTTELEVFYFEIKDSVSFFLYHFPILYFFFFFLFVIKMVFFTVSDENNNLTNLDVHEDTTVEIIMNIVEIDFNLPAAQYDLYFEGKQVQLSDTLKQLNVKDGDLLFVRKKLNIELMSELTGFNGSRGVNNEGNNILTPTDNNAVNQVNNYFANSMLNNPGLSTLVNMLKQEQFNMAVEKQATELLNLKNNSFTMEAMEHTNKELYDAIITSNKDEIKRLILKETEEEMKKEKENQKRLENAMKDPLSEESQKFIAEQIANRQVLNNRELAREHYPESFADVFMLYIRLEINKVQIVAFVDSGAQRSIMSKACAEKCNILRLLDVRYKGIAKGVGTRDVLGRIHAVDMKLGNKFFAVSLSIIDNFDIGFIFGLDMLRRHQCTIDLKQNALVIGGEVIPFLAEKDIPDYSRVNYR